LGNSGVYDGAIFINTGSVFAINSSSDYSLNGNITGAGVLTKSGTGKLTLTGTNTYTGGTELIAGTLSLDKPAPAIGQMIGPLSFHVEVASEYKIC
jgi:autotransporter-associated beta strand protein